MSKILSCAVVLLLLVGCASKQLRESPDEAINAKAASAQTQNAKAEILNFKDETGKNLSLSSVDNFETATLKDATGKEYMLKRQHAASGTYMENTDGVSIHFKNKEGVVEFSKFKPIAITQIN